MMDVITRFLLMGSITTVGGFRFAAPTLRELKITRLQKWLG